MGHKVSNWARIFWSLPIALQCTAVVFVAVVGTVSLTLVFYSVFFSDRLILDLFLSALIAVVVGYPLAYIFLRQSVRMMMLADELERVSRIDDLTQVLNRRTFFGEARALIADAAPGQGAGALLFIDVDHFKSLNDSFGHLAGDEVLRGLGIAINSCTRNCGIGGRLGGEEFAIFLSCGDRTSAKEVCERLRSQCEKIPRLVGLEEWNLTVSIGVAIHHPGQSLEELLQIADASVYSAKHQGRDRVVYQQGAGIAA